MDTGYEAKFDFPLRDGPPARPYLLATVPRSGSTFVSHVLWQTGCLGAPLEYLNFDPSGPYGHADGSAAEQERRWNSALFRRTSPNGVFGLKAFPLQFEALQRSNLNLLGSVMRRILPSRAASKVVHLRRRDRTAHAISYARAILSGIWRKEQEHPGAPEPDYSAVAVARAADLIEEQEASWAAMWADLRLDPLVLWYEDAVADPDILTREVAAYLGVALDPEARVTIPAIERQAQEGARRWARQHGGG